MASQFARKLSVVLVALFLLASLASSLPAAQAEQEVVWPQLTLVRRYGGFDRPVNASFVDDGTGRLFVGEHAGRIKVVKNGQMLPTPFLDISAKVSCCWEIGMIGMVFPSDFAQKQYFYVYYTDLQFNSVISRFWVSPTNPDQADPGSEQIVLFVRQQTAVHKGGQLAFGPDGMLYIGLGDGRYASAPNVNLSAQDPANLYGKVLRIDSESHVTPPAGARRPAPVAGAATRKLFLPWVGMGGAPAYAIPPDNPFAGVAGKRGEIWVMGLRNPFRFSFDRQTGDLYIGDVGQVRYEEVDFKAAGSPGGQNYGWPYLEGSHCYANPTCDPLSFVAPVAEYPHADGQCAISGGSVYRGPGNASMQGIYFFADFCTGRVWGIKREGGGWQTSPVLLDPDFSITGFVEDLAGNLYAVDWRGGRLYQVQEATG